MSIGNYAEAAARRGSTRFSASLDATGARGQTGQPFRVVGNFQQNRIVGPGQETIEQQSEDGVR